MTAPMKLAIPSKPATGNASVFIMTFNEAINLRRCLESVTWSDDVVVLDSYSEDDTTRIAQTFPNVRVLRRRFDDYSSQRNFGLHSVSYRNPWLLVLDADEVVEPSLAREIQETVAPTGSASGMDVYLVRRTVVLDDKRIARNSTHDFWIERLVLPTRVRYVGIVHEKLVFDGGYGRLTGVIEHHQFSKGIAQWFERRQHYSRLEAAANSQTDISTSESPTLQGLFSSHALTQRAALKRLFYRLPLRWLIYVVYNVAVKHCYLDGRTGLKYVFLEARSLYLGSRVKKGEFHAGSNQAHYSAGAGKPDHRTDVFHNRRLQHEMPALLRERRAEQPAAPPEP
jgi:glycosyltransferase involved in cell wall biosynthesis